MLGVLGLKILLIEDEAATRTISLRAPVLRSHQRFGNKCNSKPPPALEAPAPIIPPMNPTTYQYVRIVAPESERRGCLQIFNPWRPAIFGDGRGRRRDKQRPLIVRMHHNILHDCEDDRILRPIGNETRLLSLMSAL